MCILSEIRRLVKQAQVFPPVHKPEVYQQGANNIMRKGRDLVWGVLGAGAGLAKGIADRKWTIPIAPMTPMSPVTTVGKDRPEGSWGDYIRAGWNVGHDNGDLMTASMIEGAASTIPFVKFEAPSRYADRIHEMKIDNGMDPEDALSMRERAGIAGSIAASVPVFGAAGNGVKAIEKSIKASRIAKSAPRLARMASKTPAYALGWEMYGGKDVEDAAKGLWDSWKDGDPAEAGTGNGLPSWQSYSSPRNTLYSASTKVN